ncbi:hypothetical protein Hanom_Chr06g00514431 [Helianthus anomalus]
MFLASGTEYSYVDTRKQRPGPINWGTIIYNLKMNCSAASNAYIKR